MAERYGALLRDFKDSLLLSDESDELLISTSLPMSGIFGMSLGSLTSSVSGGGGFSSTLAVSVSGGRGFSSILAVSVGVWDTVKFSGSS